MTFALSADYEGGSSESNRPRFAPPVDQFSPFITPTVIKDIQLPDTMKRAMAREAEAERERRAKVISARGELQASAELRDAARTLSESPASLQLRYLQTLLELGADQNSTVVFPIPMDIVGPFLERGLRAPAADPDDVLHLRRIRSDD